LERSLCFSSLCRLPEIINLEGEKVSFGDSRPRSGELIAFRPVVGVAGHGECMVEYIYILQDVKWTKRKGPGSHSPL
jgi:hypothetical protein